MEKLQQVQKYQFWALLIVALVLPFVGWFMTRSGMIAEAADRTKVLQNVSNSLKVSPEDPNTDWQRQLDVINAEQEKQALLAWRALFDRQKPFMIWPRDMVDDPAKIEPFHQEIYRERYVDELEKVHQLVKPADEKWQSGLVKFPEELLPSPHEEWTLQAPSSKQIEGAQEDLWLLTAILGCIASVNEGSLTPFEAPIREIAELQLRGGTPKGTGGAASAASTANAPGGPSGMLAAPAGMLANRLGAGNLGGSEIANPRINADDVLGPERPAADTKSGDKPAATAPGPAGPTGGGMLKGAAPPGGNPPGDDSRRGWATSQMDRYRDDQKEFKTRGFSLQVVMDLRRVPDLLVALSNCDGWPTNILRVHEADFKDEDLVIVDGGGADGAARPMAGAGIRPPAFAGPPRGIGPRPGEEGEDGPVNSRSALDDPNLARVAIIGVIYIFKTPPEPVATAPAPETPGAPAAGSPPAASPPEATDSTPSADGEPKSESDATERPESARENDESDDKATNASSSDSPDTKSKAKPAPEGNAKPDESKSGEPQ